MPAIDRRGFFAASAATLVATRFTPAADPAAFKAVSEKAYGFLKGKQKDDGSFGSPRSGEPGLTALVAAGLIKSGVPAADGVVAKGLKYLEANVKPDGGVYAAGLANYTTSLAVLAFKAANDGGKYDAAIKNAAGFLRALQYGDDVGDKDPKYGGAGYGKKTERGGGADLSNTGFFLEALAVSGAGKDDPAVKKAVAFLGRSQNLPGESNDLPYAAKTTDDDKGGFVYNTSAAKDEKSEKRTPAGGLRSEGGMTYAGLKSFLYAGVSKDDPRVKAAVNWVRRHYTLSQNPGMGQAGLFYYYHTFAKALDALGENPFADADGKKHDWKQELFDTLKAKQNADGSWVNDKSSAYLENDPTLATAFAVLALGYTK